MADFALWVAACETGFRPEGAFEAAYSNNRRDAIENIVEADPVAAPLAHECAQNKADAVDKVKKILRGGLRNMNQVLDDAKRRKAKELVQQYVRREPDAVTLVHEALTNAGVSMDGLVADALVDKLDDIERIDRLISIAESRRNASLHEIEDDDFADGELVPELPAAE